MICVNITRSEVIIICYVCCLLCLLTKQMLVVLDQNTVEYAEYHFEIVYRQ